MINCYLQNIGMIFQKVTSGHKILKLPTFTQTNKNTRARNKFSLLPLIDERRTNAKYSQTLSITHRLD